MELGDVLQLDLDQMIVDPALTYEIAGVYGFGRGLFRRGALTGAETTYKKLNRLREGRLVVSRLKAFEGAVAVVPAGFDGCHVSPEFPTFRLTDRVLPEYMALITRWPEFWQRLKAQSRGVGARRERVHPGQLAAVVIPLPDIGEQRRLASRIDAMLGRITDALVRSALTEQRANALRWGLLRTKFETLREQFGCTSLPSVVDINPEPVTPEREFGNQHFRYVDIGSVENGSGRIGQPSEVIGIDAPSRARRRIRAGDVLVSTVRPNLRGIALVPEELDGQVCSTGFAVLRPHAELHPRFLLYQVLSDTVIDQLVEATTGGHYPAVNDRRLRAVQVVCPPPNIQQATVDRVEKSQELVRAAGERIHSRGATLSSLATTVLNRAFAQT